MPDPHPTGSEHRPAANPTAPEARPIALLQGIELSLGLPVDLRPEWIGQDEPLTQLLACWLSLSEGDAPLCPRLVGKPGLGKTTLALAAAAKRGQEAYVLQCTADTRPEDLLITPVLGEAGHIKYQASALVTAMIRGGVAVLDEGNRMSEKSWASLAPLLDDRRMIDSLVAGVQVKAHPDFRCVVTMNEDDSTFEIPDYILSRIQPAIELPFPNAEDEMRILRYNLPSAPEELLRICLGFLQKAHGLDLPYSIRDGLNAIRYAQKLHASRAAAGAVPKAEAPGAEPPGAESQTEEAAAPASDSRAWNGYFHRALLQIVGAEGLDLEALAEKRRRAGPRLSEMNLGDFFFEEDDPLNPDRG